MVHVVTDDPGAACCPGCRTPSSSPKAWATTRPKDLPYGPDPVELVWRKRRWRCQNPECARKTFTESIEAVPSRMRTTARLREAIGQGVEAGRAVDEVAAAHRVSWPTAQRAVDAYAARELGEPEPTPLLGIDETRFGRPRWLRTRDDAGNERWVRLEPWETGFVDLRCPARWWPRPARADRRPLQRRGAALAGPAQRGLPRRRGDRRGRSRRRRMPPRSARRCRPRGWRWITSTWWRWPTRP